jgi:phosphoglycolate phosphatase
LSILRYEQRHSPEVVTGDEDAAAGMASITVGVREFLIACPQSERPVVIVSNNAAAAKSDPYLAVGAVQALDRSVSGCCMIGDAVTDVEFARAAGVRAIGYAKSERHALRLRVARPDAVARTMAELVTAVLVARP